MASSCLYLEVNETFVQGRTGPSDATVCIVGADQPEARDSSSGFAAAMNAMAQELDLGTIRQAVVTIPSDWVWFRLTPMPFNDKKKLAQVLPFELAATYPDPDRPVVTDFHALKLPGRGERHHLVFSGAVDESKINDIFQALTAMGISPAVISVKGVALALSVAREQDNSPAMAFVYRSGTDTTLTLVSHGVPLMVRALKITAGSPAQRLAREIHTAWTTTGLNPLIDLDSSADLHIVLAEAGRHLEAEPDPLFDTDFIQHLKTALNQMSLRCPVQINAIDPGDLADTVTCNSQPPCLLNFCVGAYQTDSFFNRHKGRLTATLVLALLVFGLAVFDLYQKNKVLDTRINQLHTTAVDIYKRNFPGSGQVPAPLMFMESKVKQARSAGSFKGASALPAAFNIKVVELLYELSTRIPKDIDIEITRLTLNNDRIVITGLTANFNHVDKIKVLVNASSLFKNVTIQSAEADKTGQQVRFKLLLEI